ncbi:DsrE family protein [Pukyongiella litopenaei]|uniref:Uncharacterized protein n=1 Tax=Pukyongiella litopenaei TaxID=2605946 RepID=A0A2S0MMN0_9RHOB|nr:DsrE family protein [Pukyongiella litopenaei]AVO37142.1 hypothetical protein C6Y53_05110 [Pukyongiella litopenaei]
MKKRLAAAFMGILVATSALAEGVTHHIAVHVNVDDATVMNVALNNIANLNKYYQEQGDDLVVEVVTYGPGLNMVLAGKSPVADRISAMSLEMDNLTFAACANTHRAMSKKAGEDVVLLDEATMVPSGAVRLVELQEQGYSYLRP